MEQHPGRGHCFVPKNQPWPCIWREREWGSANCALSDQNLGPHGTEQVQNSTLAGSLGPSRKKPALAQYWGGQHTMPPSAKSGKELQINSSLVGCDGCKLCPMFGASGFLGLIIFVRLVWQECFAILEAT